MNRNYYPDGLTESQIDALIAETSGPAGLVRRVPSLFADREADMQRERRRSNRAGARAARLFSQVGIAAVREVA